MPSVLWTTVVISLAVILWFFYGFKQMDSNECFKKVTEEQLVMYDYDFDWEFFVGGTEALLKNKRIHVLYKRNRVNDQIWETFVFRTPGVISKWYALSFIDDVAHEWDDRNGNKPPMPIWSFEKQIKADHIRREVKESMYSKATYGSSEGSSS